MQYVVVDSCSHDLLRNFRTALCNMYNMCTIREKRKVSLMVFSRCIIRMLYLRLCGEISQALEMRVLSRGGTHPGQWLPCTCRPSSCEVLRLPPLSFWSEMLAEASQKCLCWCVKTQPSFYSVGWPFQTNASRQWAVYRCLGQRLHKRKHLGGPGSAMDGVLKLGSSTVYPSKNIECH